GVGRSESQETCPGACTSPGLRGRTRTMSERKDNLGSSKTWLRPLWLGSLVAASAALTAVYTRVTPFAAFPVIAATSLPRGPGVSFMTAVGLPHQGVGFGVLSEP